MTAAGVSEAERWRDRERYRPSYNCSPGAWIPVIKLGADGAREVQTMKWGLVPAFTRPGERLDHFRMFNARCESLAQKPVFSRLLPGKRCVVLLDGFYEWHSQGGGGGGAASRKQPYHITTADAPQQPAMYLAGLYDVYRDASNGEPLHTFTIITTDSSKPLAWLHDRMPVILTTQEEVSAWLGEGKAAAAAGQTAKAAVEVKEEEKERGDGAAAAAAAMMRERKRSSPPPPRPSVGSPSTPSSHGRSAGGRRASGPSAAPPSAGEGGSETRAAGDGAAEAIEVSYGIGSGEAAEATDAPLSGDQGHNDGDGDYGFGDEGYGDGDEGDDDDDDDGYGDRFSAGRVGSSQEEVKKGVQPRKGSGGGTAAAAAAAAGKGKVKGKVKGQDGAVSEVEKLLCEELVDKICRPYGGPLLQWHPVTPEMGKPSYDKPDCCKDVHTKKGSISSFFKPAAAKATPRAAAAVGGVGAGSPPASSPIPAAAVRQEEQQQKQKQKQQCGEGVGATGKGEAGRVKSEAGAAAGARNPDECEGAGGEPQGGGSGVGLKRPAEGEAGQGNGAGSAVKKR
ncbi:hypothetical protein PLESTF_000562500 [Pleodorina starrii]|nr:hypothetical protein PLESTF_000562500 [Pleodorina starrii]